jgi:hypothetical protein
MSITILDSTAIDGTISITSIANATTNTNRFLVSDSGVVKYRTGAQLRSDIGAGTSSTVGTVTSIGGTGTVSGLTLSGTVTVSGNLTLAGSLVLTSANVTSGLGFTPYNATNPAGYTTNTGTVTSVGISHAGNAFTAGSAITTSGTLAITMAGTSAQYINGAGNLTTFPAIPQGDITAVVAGTGISGGGTSGSVTITNSDRGSSQFIFKNVASDSGTAVADNNNDTLSIVGAGSVTTAVVGDILTITGSDDNDNFYVTGASYASGTLTLTRNGLSDLTATGFPTNNNQLTNGAGYTTNTGTTTASNTQTFTNKSGSNLQWTNDAGYVTSSGGSMSSWNIRGDSGTSAAVTDGQTVTIQGGANITTSSNGYIIDIVNDITNNNQLTNGAGYTTNTGTTTPSNTQTFTNKSGSNNQWTNDSGYITAAALPTVSNATVSVTTGTGLDGATSFTLNQAANKTIALTLDLNELGAGGTLVATDSLVAVNGTTSNKQLISSIPLSIFNNNAGWTSNVGDITGVTAGTGISGGGTSGTVTITNSDRGSSQNIFKNVASDSGTAVADNNNDTLTISGGSNVTTSVVGDVLTINATINPGDITGVTATTPLTGGGTSGNITVGIQTASASQAGALSAANWTTFNNKTTNTGTVTSVASTVQGTAMNIGGSPITSSGTLAFGFAGGAGEYIDGAGDLQAFPSIPQGDITAVVAGVGLTGGGTSGSVTLNNSITNNNQLTNGAGYTTNVGDITGVTAGSGMSGGGTSGTVTLTNSDKGSSQNIFKTVAVSGQSSVVADSNSDTLTLAAGNNITLTTNATTDTVTITANINPGDITGVTATSPLTGGGTSGTVALGIQTASASQAGALSAANWTTFNNKTTNTGTVTSVNASIGGSALAVSGGAITTAGTLAFAYQGNSGEYIDGAGDLQNFPGIPQGDITNVVAGTGMTGGGTSGSVTLNVIGSTGITANANNIAIDATVATLAGTQTFTNKSGNISQWTNDSGYTTNVGDITGVTAGTGISGGGTSGTVTVTNSDRGSSQNIFKNIAVSGQSTVVADSNNDTLTFVASGGMTITTNATTDTITFNPNDDNDNFYVTGGSYDLATGILDLSRNGLSTLQIPNFPTDNAQLANGAGYITSYVNTTYTAGTGLTLTGTVFSNDITNNNQLTNGAGYITAASLQGVPAILSNGSTPSLNTGISAAEVRSLIGAGTSSLTIGTTASTAKAGNTTTITSAQASAITANTAKVTDTGVPAMLSNGTTPSLNSGISAAEVRSLIGAGTSSTSGTVTSAGLVVTNGNSIAITNTPITTSGDLEISFIGQAGEYINGDGDLITFPSIPQGDITAVVAGTGMTGGGTSGSVTLNCSITNNNQLTNGAGYITAASLQGVPAILSNGTTPSLNTGISAAEVRSLIGAGTSSLTIGTTSSTAKAGNTTTITSAQASAITANTAKVGITSTQASNITTNNAKVGITSTQASNITTNNAKVTDSGTPAILSNGTVPSLNTGISAAEVRNLIGAGTSSSTGTVTSVGTTGSVSGITLSGTVTTSGNLTLGGTLSLTSANVTGGLGFTPYNATNPAGYTTNTGTTTASNSQTFTNKSGSNNQWINDAGYITSYVNTTYTAGSGLSLTGTVFANTSPNIVQTTISGNAGSATALQTARRIAGVFFNGTADISLNNSSITNGAGYTTNTGTTTASNSQTFTNKSGNVSQWTNDAGYLTSAPGGTIYTPDIWGIDPGFYNQNAQVVQCNSQQFFTGTTNSGPNGALPGSLIINDVGMYEITYQAAANVSSGVSSRQVPALYITESPPGGPEQNIPGSLMANYLRLPGSNQGGFTSFSNTCYFDVTQQQTTFALKIVWLDGTNRNVNIYDANSVPSTISIKRIT